MWVTGGFYPPKYLREKRVVIDEEERCGLRDTFDNGGSVCEILKVHHEKRINDPERLPTDFLKSLINKKEDPCPDIGKINPPSPSAKSPASQ
jgi:hypothetical protein